MLKLPRLKKGEKEKKRDPPSSSFTKENIPSVSIDKEEGEGPPFARSTVLGLA